MSCTTSAVPAKALAGWRAPVSAGGTGVGFPSHRRCRRFRATRENIVTTWHFAPRIRVAVSAASCDAGAAAGAPREISRHLISSHFQISNRIDITARAVTDPSGVRGAEDDGVGDGDGEEKRRDKPSASLRENPATTASPQRRRGGTSDLDMRTRAAIYGHGRERNRSPRGDDGGWSRDDETRDASLQKSKTNVVAKRAPSPMRDRRREYLKQQRENQTRVDSNQSEVYQVAGDITERFGRNLRDGDLEACVFELEAALLESPSVKKRVGRTLVPMHKRFLHKCVDLTDPPRLDLALRYANVLPPDPRLFASTLATCARLRDFEAASRVFAMYATNNMAPDNFAYSGIISAAGKAGGKLHSARALLTQAETDLGESCDVGVYNAFIDACAREGDVASAQATVDVMRQRKSLPSKPNTRTYNSVITAAARARDLGAAKRALTELEDDETLEPTDRTFGAALAAAATSEPMTHTDVQWALDTYARFVTSHPNFAANNHASSSLLTVLARGVAAGAWPGEDAVRRAGATVDALVTQFAKRNPGPASITPNAAVWSAHMSVCARAGNAREAIAALALMRKCGARLDAYTLASALTACRGFLDNGNVVSHRGSLGDEASFELPDSPDASAVLYSNSPPPERRATPEAAECLRAFEQADPDVSGSVAVKNAAIALYASVGYTEKAFATYESMRDVTKWTKNSEGDAMRNIDGEEVTSEPFEPLGSTTPDTITYNTLIAACASSDRPGRATELLKDMCLANVPRSLRTYVGLMTAASRFAEDGAAGSVAARAMFEACEQDATVTAPHNAFTYTALIDAQVKGGDCESAFVTFESMKLANVDPTVVTFGCLLNACRIGVADENASCAESDLRRGTHEAGSNARTTATGTNTFVTGTNLEPTKSSIAVTRAYDLLQQMQTYNICPNDRCQNALVRVIAEAGRVDDALDEVKKISRKGGRFERATLEGVVVALCLGGYAERGLRIVGWMSVRGFVPCAATYRQLTRSLCAEGEVRTAWATHLDAGVKLGGAYKLDKATSSALIASLCRASVVSLEPQNALVMCGRAIGVFSDAATFGVAKEGDFVATQSSGSTSRRQPIRPTQTETETDASSANAKDSAKSATPADQILTPAAARALVTSAARCSDLKFALSMYRSAGGKKALRLRVPPRTPRGGHDSQQNNVDDRAGLFEALIETCCHDGDVNGALEVFDDLKVCTDVVVGKVTLAFLESVCRRSRVPEYRVFDVCAQMRAQAYEKQERKSERPEKRTSHHVFGSVADELSEPGLGVGTEEERGRVYDEWDDDDETFNASRR